MLFVAPTKENSSKREGLYMRPNPAYLLIALLIVKLSVKECLHTQGVPQWLLLKGLLLFPNAAACSASLGGCRDRMWADKASSVEALMVVAGPDEDGAVPMAPNRPTGLLSPLRVPRRDNAGLADDNPINPGDGLRLPVGPLPPAMPMRRLSPVGLMLPARLLLLLLVVAVSLRGGWGGSCIPGRVLPRDPSPAAVPCKSDKLEEGGNICATPAGVAPIEPGAVIA